MSDRAAHLTELGKIALLTFTRTLAGMLVLALVLAGTGFALAGGAACWRRCSRWA